MEAQEMIFMKKGDGENSYAQNSLLTQKVASMTKPLLENAVGSLFSKGLHLNNGVLNVADLGCAAGPNTFSIISTVKETVEKKSQESISQMPELQVYLNDLPGNDFNTLFRGLTSSPSSSASNMVVGENCERGISCFVMGVPGSFHGRLFPRNSLHFVHSSYSVHWLSQAPKGLTNIGEGLALNKGKIYVSKTSPPGVREAYLSQFQEDFTNFLKSRSQEVCPNGCMVLILHGQISPDPSSKESSYTWELIAEAISQLVSEGLVEEEKLDSFNVPYYTPSAEEVGEIVEREGSFAIEHMEAFRVEVGTLSRGEKLAKMIRGFTESMITHQFGEETMHKIYHKLTQLLVADLSKGPTPVVTVTVVLNKN